MQTTLSMIAHGRSGDKGNHSNIAVIAYQPAGYDWILENLTADVVRGHFADLMPTKVERYEAPNLMGLNFMLYNVLDGGASLSLRIDTQGKAFAFDLLQMPIDVRDVKTMLRSCPPSEVWQRRNTSG